MNISSIAMSLIQSQSLMRTLLGIQLINRRSFVSIRKKFWIAVVLYILFLWCLATVFTLLLIELM